MPNELSTPDALLELLDEPRLWTRASASTSATRI